jgi:hypothetical protein
MTMSSYVSYTFLGADSGAGLCTFSLAVTALAAPATRPLSSSGLITLLTCFDHESFCFSYSAATSNSGFSSGTLPIMSSPR